jgi:hypothetical protein
MGIVIDDVGERRRELRLTRPLALALAHEALQSFLHVFPEQLDPRRCAGNSVLIRFQCHLILLWMVQCGLYQCVLHLSNVYSALNHYSELQSPHNQRSGSNYLATRIWSISPS